MRNWIVTSALCLIIGTASSQNIAINEDGSAPDPSAMLDISSTNKGILVPRLITHTAIAAPATGLLVYNTTTSTFWFFNGTDWIEITFPVAEIRDADSDTWVTVEYTADEDIIRFGAASDTSQMHFDGKTLHWTNNNIFIGDQSGALNSGENNTYLGFRTGSNVNAGSRSVVIGSRAAETATSLSDQLIIGFQAGSSLTNPSDANTFIGGSAGRNAITTRFNTFVGTKAGLLATGNDNTFIGDRAGERVTSATQNTYVGGMAGARNKTGNYNVAIGHGAHGDIDYNNPVTAQNNVYIGRLAGKLNNSNANVMVGANSGEHFDVGWNNTFVGYRSGRGPTSGSNHTGANNAFFGYQSGMKITSGNKNTVLGAEAGDKITSHSGNVFIGYKAGWNFNQSNTLIIANDEDAQDVLIYGLFRAHGNGPKVAINQTSGLPNATFTVNGSAYKTDGGINWSIPSDKRIKRDIKEFNDGIKVVMQLQPVKFRYTENSGAFDTESQIIGFIAQDVEKLAPYMVSQFDDSEGTSGLSDKRILDESALNKVLVNAIQEQQAQIVSLEDRIAKLEKLLLRENAVVSEVK